MSEIKVTANKLKRRKNIVKKAKIIILILLVLFTTSYIILGIIYNGGRFTVTLDPNFSIESGITLYESLNNKSKTNKPNIDSTLPISASSSTHCPLSSALHRKAVIPRI